MSRTSPDATDRPFPLAAGLLFGLGLGGFFDGIVLHQLLQWHHMLSSWYPVDTIENLKLNTLWDGIFHSATYLFVLAGLLILWQTARRRHLRWSSRLLLGTMLQGFGAFNVVEGLVDHHLLGIHHVNEVGDPAFRLHWDVAFIAWGVIMVVLGTCLVGRRQDEGRADL
ncbi:MAG: DUF2243 domain-containing protein [Hyphomicrobiaceae bacterium]|nr:DUF2243 domain-containing protein [Hyphomicrobiaceae bacterium]